MSKRVVITGMGAVSSMGDGVAALWDGLKSGRSAIRKITLFDASPYRNDIGGPVDGYDPDPEDPRALRFLDHAVAEAVANAGLNGNADPVRAGIVLGTNFGGMSAAERMMVPGDAGLPDEGLNHYNFSAAADRVAEQTGFTGPRTVLSLACASGTAALGQAMDWIRLGHADVVVAAGFDELSEFCYAGLSALRAITPETIRPFDVNRKGTLFGEGAGVFVVESAEHAEARGARIYVECAGRALNNDAYHMTAPEKEGKGIAALMRAALSDAGLDPEDIAHINCHGTGTPYNDVIETRAIKTVFGDLASKLLLTANKSMIGHGQGAAGALEAICAVHTIREGIVPPTVNYETPDPECDLDCCPNEPREVDVPVALSNSYGIGGTNACIVLKRTV